MKVGGGTIGSRDKTMPGSFFIETFKHRGCIKKGTHAEHGEEGAQKQGFTKSMGNNFQDSL